MIFLATPGMTRPLVCLAMSLLPLQTLAQSPTVPCAQFEQGVARYQARFQSRMLGWSAKALSDVKARTAFYPSRVRTQSR